MLFRHSKKRPGLIEPCIPTVASRPPAGPQWVHEIKHDGYRLIARKQDGRPRRGYDWSDHYPRISTAVAALRTASATLDGEAVWCDDDGLAVFEKLHSRAYDDQVFLYAFDLLELDGEDWRPRPLEARKAKLERLLARANAGVRFGEHPRSPRRPVSKATPAILSRATGHPWSYSLAWRPAIADLLHHRLLPSQRSCRR